MSSENNCFVIAEAGVNHNGELLLAKKLVDAAVEAGANAVKFQTFKTELLVTQEAESAEYQKRNTLGETHQFEMLKKLELSEKDFVLIKEYCENKKIEFLSSPFDEESATFLIKNLGMGKVKIPSGEITNLPLIKHVSSFEKPLILSTGMCDLDEIKTAIETIQGYGRSAISLLHCTSNYPCPYEEVNLNAMKTLEKTFQFPVGYSDHTAGIEVSIAAVAMGASIIEKHFTLDRNLPGPDHRCSLEPKELRQMVSSIRNIEKAMGSEEKKPTDSEMEIAKKVRKTMVASRNLSTGTILTRNDLIAKRAGSGISPKNLEQLIGKKLVISKKADQPVEWEDFE